MHHDRMQAAQWATFDTILAFQAEMASAALAKLLPEDRTLGEAFDRTIGRGKWFLFWDEDLCGKPIRGTITIAWGSETLTVG